MSPDVPTSLGHFATGAAGRSDMLSGRAPRFVDLSGYRSARHAHGRHRVTAVAGSREVSR
jgi:hypothetical protein